MPLCPQCKDEAKTTSRDIENGWLTQLLKNAMDRVVSRDRDGWDGECDECGRCGGDA
jgi:hypothetical protein